ncbi:16S rRNA-processing protein [marine gamma proteobacterium HTCC2143]|jgi:16S rRNA processing protein RimM|uniref:Ribosome maturation factor RimM n=1 Tax=marine gamma proteobacterium HTCC2143 TaxID=247633 RepID=A0YHP4_9GAMM|nr:16S rRNA-processing protein [marine gamma proteobacterium HTCC2143]
MMVDSSELVVIGKITAVYGVKGWVKVHSFTDPMENILGYQSYYLSGGNKGTGESWQSLSFDEVKYHGKGLVALIEGVSDREVARGYCQRDIAIPISEMPELDTDDFYWRDLIGLKVFSVNIADEHDADTEQIDPVGHGVLLGAVHQMMETGANDVLAVKQCDGSIDDQERLIPWLPDQVVKHVDIEAGFIQVDWPVDF